ncbi:MAG TPA: hypothetical protein VNN22_14630 [Verrucomicrobiae bacterium]|nr:hypothetical protein [Verrucomicrobiae bacterium]
MKKFRFPLWLFTLTMLIPHLAVAQTQPVAVTVTDAGGADLPPRFLGLSYESSMLLPDKDGHYYFDAGDKALLNTFKTLGIKSLRVGANAVDDPRIPVPQKKDIDALFNFARAAGVKVIYSFRLKNGDSANSARLASYIVANDADVLECFSIGNEPHLYPAKTNEPDLDHSANTNVPNVRRPADPHQTYASFYAQWKPQYDAILKAVPNAMIDGPSADGNFAVHLAKDVSADGHLAMASDHYYFLGSGRAAETDPPAARDRFLSNKLHGSYENAYAKVGAVLAVQGVPYRIDELNSCYNGGAKDSSDTYAATLWALDCINWWAAHHILGMNFHTGESVGRDGKFGPPNYAAFLQQANGAGFSMRPQAYAYLAFSQGAHGRPLDVKLQATNNFNFNAYAYQDGDGSIYVTLINKSYGDKAQPASVSLQLPNATAAGTWQRMDLVQNDQDVAAKTDVMLGGASINAQGIWAGQWTAVDGGNSGDPTVQVAPASATILHFSPTK